MTAAKTTTLLTCTALVCLGTGLIGSWALGAGDGSDRGTSLPTTADTTGEASADVPTLELAQSDSPGASTEGAYGASYDGDYDGEGYGSGDIGELSSDAATPTVRSYQRMSASREKIEGILDDDIFEQDLPVSMPLFELAALLEEIYEFPVRLDEQNLLDEGISPDEELGRIPSGLPLRDALDLILENVAGVPLDYVIENSVLKITTAEIAEEKLETVIYELRHLYPNLRTEDIIDLLQNTVSGPWQETDIIGGTIVELPGALAVRQSQRVHREIAALLEQVEQFAARSEFPTIERTDPAISDEDLPDELRQQPGSSLGGGARGGGFYSVPAPRAHSPLCAPTGVPGRGRW